MFPARMRQAGHDPGFDRIARDDDDRDLACRFLRCQGAGDVERHDHVDLEPDELGREPRKPIQLSLRGAKLEGNVLPLHVAELTRSFAEFLLERIRVRDSYVEGGLFELP
jgi:hypothetical protein